MGIDTQESLLNHIYNILTEDLDLQEIMGNVVLYPLFAAPDTAFPYLVHRVDLRAEPGECPVTRKGTYIIDIWSNSDNANEVLAIRKCIIELLDELRFETAELRSATLWTQTEGFIPDEPGIWHYAIQFNLYFVRLAEMEAIETR